jgi:hypothetical protein
LWRCVVEEGCLGGQVDRLLWVMYDDEIKGPRRECGV